jgi:hypothetical protein
VAIAVSLLYTPVSAAFTNTSSNAYTVKTYDSKGYSTTLAGMAGRRLYSYGIVIGTEDEFSEDSLALDTLLSWSQLCALIDRLVPEKFSSDISNDEISPWALEAYRNLIAHEYMSEDDTDEPISRNTVVAILRKLLDNDSFDDIDSIDSGTITRGECFELIYDALDTEIGDSGITLQESLDEIGALTHETQFQRPTTLSVYATDADDAWSQIERCLKYSVVQIYVYNIGPDNSYLKDINETIQASNKAARAGAAATDETVFLEYFFYYDYGLNSQYNETLEKVHIWTPNRYSDISYIRTDLADWIQYYESDEIVTAYKTFVEETLDPLRDLSDYEKVKAVNNIICNRCDYNYAALVNGASADTTKNAHSIFGFFVDGKIVCDGYAYAAQAMLTELGVPCIMLLGTGGGGSHAWNKVQINGNWYNLDVCWNDTCGYRYYYLLKSDSYMLWNQHTYSESNYYNCSKYKAYYSY